MLRIRKGAWKPLGFNKTNSCMATPFFLSGSRSSQLDELSGVHNPLPPCPGSPNCIRLSRQLEITVDEALPSVRKVLERMQAESIEVDRENCTFHSVFTALFFKDDVTIKLRPAGPGTCYLHIRSASRIGRSDLGVNRRRVKRFLRLLHRESDST